MQVCSAYGGGGGDGGGGDGGGGGGGVDVGGTVLVSAAPDDALQFGRQDSSQLLDHFQFPLYTIIL